MKDLRRYIVNNYIIVLGSVFLLFGFIIRWKTLSFHSLWYDELFSVIQAEKSFLSLLSALQTESNPSLYTILLHFWIKIFGNSPVSVRGLSAFISSLTLIFLFYLSTTNKKKSDFLFFLFITVSFGAFYYSQETRAYALMIFFSILISYKFLEIVQRDSISQKDWWNFFLLGTILSHTHYFGFLYLGHLYIFLLFLTKRIYPVLGFASLSIIAYIPELYKIVFILPHLPNIDWIPKPNLFIYLEASNLTLSMLKGNGVQVWILVLVTILISGYKRESSNNRELKILISLGLSFLVSTFFLSQIKPMVTGRNLLVLIFPFLYSLSLWISSESKFPHSGKVLLTLLICFFSFQSYYKSYLKPFKEEFREAAHSYLQIRQESDISFCQGDTAFYNYYLDRNHPSHLVREIPLKEDGSPDFEKIPARFIFWDRDLQIPDSKILLSRFKENDYRGTTHSFRGLRFIIWEKKK